MSTREWGQGYDEGYKKGWDDAMKEKPAQPEVCQCPNCKTQRTWVGLTQEDIDIAFDETQEGGGFWEFADAIEAKLKEKNA